MSYNSPFHGGFSSGLFARRACAAAVDMFLGELVIMLSGRIASIFAENAAAQWLVNVSSQSDGYKIIFLALVWALFCLRDISGRSLGRRIMRLKVTTDEDKAPARWRLIVRNLTTIVWPVELIAVLLNDSRLRISDRLLKMKVSDALDSTRQVKDADLPTTTNTLPASEENKPDEGTDAQEE